MGKQNTQQGTLTELLADERVPAGLTANRRELTGLLRNIVNTIPHTDPKITVGEFFKTLEYCRKAKEINGSWEKTIRGYGVDDEWLADDVEYYARVINRLQNWDEKLKNGHPLKEFITEHFQYVQDHYEMLKEYKTDIDKGWVE